MEQFTKKAIRDSFLKLLAKSPIDSIKVVDITRDCGISRNTFYYHYRDIYDVMKELFETTLEQILNKNNFNWYKVFEDITSSVLLNKNVLRNVSSSKYYREFEMYLYKAVEKAFSEKIRITAKGKNISDENIRLLSVLYTHAIIGTYSEWVQNGMKTDLKKYIKKFGALAANNIESSLDILNSI